MTFQLVPRPDDGVRYTKSTNVFARSPRVHTWHRSLTIQNYWFRYPNAKNSLYSSVFQWIEMEQAMIFGFVHHPGSEKFRASRQEVPADSGMVPQEKTRDLLKFLQYPNISTSALYSSRISFTMSWVTFFFR